MCSEPRKPENVGLSVRDLLLVRLAVWMLRASAVALIAAYSPAIVFWWHEWLKPGGLWSHGPLVPIISLVFIVRARL